MGIHAVNRTVSGFHWLALLLLACLVGCGGGGSSSSNFNPQASEEPDQETQQVGLEIIEIQSLNSQRAWISSDITREEFEALELPDGWIKNQPREDGNPKASGTGRFLRSPDAEEEGEYIGRAHV